MKIHLIKERGRIAYDLHDELGPVLSYIKLQINIFELSNVDDKVQIGKINDNIDKVLNRLREISYNLMPPVLINSGLSEALKEYVNNIDRHLLKIDITFPGDIVFGEENAINIYRIVQEVIHNAIKHSGATNLGIVFKNERNKIIISLKDNGIGFEESEIVKKEGLGFKSLQSRTQLMNGKMFITSKKGFGTEFIFEIPF